MWTTMRQSVHNMYLIWKQGVSRWLIFVYVCWQSFNIIKVFRYLSNGFHGLIHHHQTSECINTVSVWYNLNIPTYAHSIHVIGLCASRYSLYLICNEFYPHRPRLGPKPSQSQPSLTALARPADFESRSRRKPGRNITKQRIARSGQNLPKHVSHRPKHALFRAICVFGHASSHLQYIIGIPAKTGRRVFRTARAKCGKCGRIEWIRSEFQLSLG